MYSVYYTLLRVFQLELLPKLIESGQLNGQKKRIFE